MLALRFFSKMYLFTTNCITVSIFNKMMKDLEIYIQLQKYYYLGVRSLLGVVDLTLLLRW